MQIGSTGANLTGTRGAEGNDGGIPKIVPLQEGVENLRRLPPPDGVPQKHHIIVFWVLQGPLDRRTGIGVILLSVGATIVVIVV